MATPTNSIRAKKKKPGFEAQAAEQLESKKIFRLAGGRIAECLNQILGYHTAPVLRWELEVWLASAPLRDALQSYQGSAIVADHRPVVYSGRNATERNVERRLMRILVAWDNEAEAELISSYLGVDENEVTMTTSPAGFRSAIESGRPTDIVLMTIGLQDSESEFELFTLVRERYPESPVVGACSPSDVFCVVRFMVNGMSAYLTRDASGDYMFLMQAVMNSTLDAVRAAREKDLAQKLREEVESVRKLQESVLPKKIVSPCGYHICARFEPADLHVSGGQSVAMAGGDYYDVYTIANGKMVLLVGDATGHGMRACMSIMTMHTLFRIMLRHEYANTAHFVTEINKLLCEQSIVNQKGGFITLLYAVLDPGTRTLHWSSAGHQPPLLQNLTTGSIEPLAGQDTGGLPLAVDEDAEYESYSCMLPENCRLLLYTDGLEEAFPDEDEKNHFGKDGIVKTLSESVSLSLEKTLARLFDASNDFTKGSGRRDDTSIVLLEHRS